MKEKSVAIFFPNLLIFATAKIGEIDFCLRQICGGGRVLVPIGSFYQPLKASNT